MPLYFVTGNAHKLAEARLLIPDIEGVEIEVPEIQSMDPEEIIAEKLSVAARSIDGEIIVEDTSLFIDELGGLPGPLVKWFMGTVGDEGLARMALNESRKPRARAQTIIGHRSADGTIRYFTGVVPGTIVAPDGARGFGWDTIFLPEGETDTFALMPVERKNEISMRAQAFRALADYLQSVQ